MLDKLLREDIIVDYSKQCAQTRESVEVECVIGDRAEKLVSSKQTVTGGQQGSSQASVTVCS